MRILITGHNLEKAQKICQELVLDKKAFFHNDLPPGISLSTNLFFPAKMRHYLAICQQGYKPGMINFYNYSPWSQKDLWTNNKEEQETLDQYQYVIGWKPDIVIYLFDIDNPSSFKEKIVYDNDRRQVKIYRINAFENQLKSNLIMILGK
jgi:hypothetical protein